MGKNTPRTLIIVDTENVGASAYDDIKEFMEKRLNQVEFTLFISEHSQVLAWKYLYYMSQGEINFKMTKANTPNAMDFQIVTYAGTKITQKKIEEIYFLTKDKGFEAASSMLNNDYGKVVKRISSISELVKNSIKEIDSLDFRKYPGLSKKIHNPDVVDIVKQARALDNLNEKHNFLQFHLQKVLPKEVITDIYKIQKQIKK